jgi:RNA polymerase sigma factor (sigma-70 family)
LETLEEMRSAKPDDVLKKVYTANYAWLEQYICTNSGSAEDAKDIFQESVSAAWLNLKEGRFSGNGQQFNAYVRQICKFKWLNELKSAARSKTMHAEDMAVFDTADAVDGLEEQLEQGQRLNRSFNLLGERCRDVLIRFYYKRQSLADIAAAMHQTEESMKTTKYRCMVQLRKLFLEQTDDHEG